MGAPVDVLFGPWSQTRPRPSSGGLRWLLGSHAPWSGTGGLREPCAQQLEQVIVSGAEESLCGGRTVRTRGEKVVRHGRGL